MSILDELNEQVAETVVETPAAEQPENVSPEPTEQAEKPEQTDEQAPATPQAAATEKTMPVAAHIAERRKWQRRQDEMEAKVLQMQHQLETIQGRVQESATEDPLEAYVRSKAAEEGIAEDDVVPTAGVLRAHQKWLQEKSARTTVQDSLQRGLASIESAFADPRFGAEALGYDLAYSTVANYGARLLTQQERRDAIAGGAEVFYDTCLSRLLNSNTAEGRNAEAAIRSIREKKHPAAKPKAEQAAAPAPKRQEILEAEEPVEPRMAVARSLFTG